MASLTVQQRLYQAASPAPFVPPAVNKPLLTTAAGGTSMLLTAISVAARCHPTLSIGFATLSVLPLVHYGRVAYTDWLPKLVKMTIGEVQRRLTDAPAVKLGLIGWQLDSTHSHHFDETLGNGLVGFCQEKNLRSAADFDCGGQGQYARVLTKAGIQAQGYDFSQASANQTPNLVHVTLEGAALAQQYDLVTSFEVLSKTLPGQQEAFVAKLVDATTPGGFIVMSCAVPGQSGPNSNPLTNDAVKALFAAKGCQFLEPETNKFRHLTNPMHTWFPNTLLVFQKPL